MPKRDHLEFHDKSSVKGSKEESIRASLGDCLSFGLLAFPQLADELPGMIQALDKGQCILIGNVEDVRLRAFLNALFGKYMTEIVCQDDTAAGWRLISKSSLASKYITRYLLIEEESIIQPGELNSVQAQATRFTTRKLLKLMSATCRKEDDNFVCSGGAESYDDLQSILSTLKRGDTDISMDANSNDDYDSDSSIHDIQERQQKYLMELLHSMDFKSTSSLPSSKKHFTQSANFIEQCGFILKLFESANRYRRSMEINSDKIGDKQRSKPDEISKLESITCGERDKEYDSSDSRSSNSSNNSNSSCNSSRSSSSSKSGFQSRVKGPSAMPSHFSNTSANSKPVSGPLRPVYGTSDILIERFRSANESDESDDDQAVIGPTFPDISSKSRSSETMNFPSARTAPPLGALVSAAERGDYDSDNDDALAATATATATAALGREEWMLSPGDEAGHIFGGMKDSGVVSNRKFQANKTAKHLANALNKHREEQEKISDDSAARKVMEEYREKRGPSLMEMHLEKKQKTKHSNSSGSTRERFDREKDLLSHKKLSAFQVERLVENAKQLDDKFSKGYIQGSSL